MLDIWYTVIIRFNI